jgi:hypothetical protein
VISSLGGAASQQEIAMRNLKELDEFRDISPEVIARYKSIGDGTCGVFNVPSPDGLVLRTIASSGASWDHVSVSLPDRCPTWQEMDLVARLFFRKYEVPIQFHVPTKDNINLHPYCLHLWRYHRRRQIMPPAWMVG